MSFKDLVFNRVTSTQKGDVSQAIVRFANGLGLSVLTGPGTFTTFDRPYEAAVISFAPDGSYKIIYPDFTHNDVLTFLTEDQVSEYMERIASVRQTETARENRRGEGSGSAMSFPCL